MKKGVFNKYYNVNLDNFTFNGVDWRVNGNGGINTRNLQRIFQQVDVMLYKFSRVCVVRFDLRPISYSPNNEQMTTFRRRLFKQLKTKYNIAVSDIAYCWCREQEKAKGQHYHWVLMVDGKKVRSAIPGGGIGKLIVDIYDKLDGSVHLAGYHNVKRGDLVKQRSVMNHISYLAKTRGKGYAGGHVKNFTSSKTQYPDGEINCKGKGLCSSKVNLVCAV